jgi:hypothetical protein
MLGLNYIRRCDVCREPLGGVEGLLCGGCKKALDRINGTGETTMAKKTGKKATGEKKSDTTATTTVGKDGSVRRVHRLVEPVEPVIETAPESEEIPEVEVDGTGEGGDIPGTGEGGSFIAFDEAAESNASAQAAASSSTPMQAGRFAWLKRVNATRALQHGIAQISKYDYSEWGISGVSGALAILRNAEAAMTALNKKSGAAAKVAPGMKVNIREKTASTYDSIIDGDDRKGLEVIAVKKRFVVAKTSSGEKVTLPVAHVEVAS